MARTTVPPKRDALPGYFYRLSAQAQRWYLTSNSMDRFEGFTPSASSRRRLDDLLAALDSGKLSGVQQAAAAMMNELCRIFGVPPIRLEVRGVRPHNSRGELHGLFRVTNPPEIQLWMRTAQRHETVKPRTFLRTLLHELCHYLDYSLLKLGDSFHTMGFFKRESFLVSMMMPRTPNFAARTPSLVRQPANYEQAKIGEVLDLFARI